MVITDLFTLHSPPLTSCVSPPLFLTALQLCAAVVSVVWCLLSWCSEPMPDVIVNFEGERENHARGYFVVSDLDETQRC